MKRQPLIRLIPDIHHKGEVIRIEFAYNRVLIEKVKQVPGARWSVSKKCWYLSAKNFRLRDFYSMLKEDAYIDYSALTTNEKYKKPLVAISYCHDSIKI